MARPEWPLNRPAPTIVGTRRSQDGILVGRQLDTDDRRDLGGWQSSKGLGAGQLAGVRVSLQEAATLQSYPSHLPPAPVFRNGNQRNAAKRPPEAPAPTIMFGARSNKVEWVSEGVADDPASSGARVSIEEAAALQSYPTHLKAGTMTSNLIALDLFAGTGWGVACRLLGIEEYGVDIMPEVVETREANGMKTVFRDVWAGLLPEHSDENIGPEARYALDYYNLLIASPPCQSFSAAGKGEGRKSLDIVLRAIEERTYTQPEILYGLQEITDPRTALVLTPLAYAYRDRPTYVVLEQVPTVLPVWEAVGKELEKIGYSVWVGNLQSEQYGVPQTRKRAILIARSDGIEAAPPKPTHSRYYPRDPKRLDPGVKKWVSMAEALGWEVDGEVVLRSNYGTGGDPANRGERSTDEPAATVTSKVDRNKWVAAKVQGSGRVERHGERPPRELDEPAFTIRANAGGMEPGGFRFEERVESVPGDPSWVEDRPSPTIVGSFSPQTVAAPGYRKPGDGPRQNAPGSVKVTVEEASTLQSYPPMEWRGSNSKKFLQIGNAVPPRLAEAILSTLM